jgi:hypothetical protein
MKLSEKLYKKYKNKKNTLIIECILQLYLLEINFREFAQLSLWNFDQKTVGDFMIFINKSEIPYFEFTNGIIIIYKKGKFNIENINDKFGKKYAKKLGNFYKCANNNFSKNDVRIVISLNKYNLNSMEIYAQMCSEKQIKKNFKLMFDIYLKLFEIFKKFDKTLFCNLNIYKVNKK